jgi:hypothetical protein
MISTQRTSNELAMDLWWVGFSRLAQLRTLSIHYKYKLSYQKVTNDRAKLLGSMIKKLFEYLELQAKELSYINRFFCSWFIFQDVG